MQLSHKQKPFAQFFTPFLKFRLNFNHFEEKDDPHRFCIFKVTDSEIVVRKCLKIPASEDASTSNMLNVPKHYRNLHHSAFITFIGHWQRNCVRKSLCY